MTGSTLRWLAAAYLLLSSAAFATDAALQAVMDAHWRWTLAESPEMRREYGDNSGNTQWTDRSLSAYAARDAQREAFINQLLRIEPATLSEANRLNRSMLLGRLRDERNAYADGLHLIAIDMRSGPQHRYQLAERLPFTSEQDYRDWLARLTALPEHLDQYRELLSAGIARDRVQAAIIMARVPEQIERVTVAPEDSPFFTPFRDMNPALPVATQEALRDEAARLIRTTVNPAYQAFGAFIEETYLPAAREAPGLGGLEGGKVAYANLVKRYTTTDMTPEQVHEIGLAEVARIRAEMEAIIAEVGFEGGIAEFSAFLRTDPRFYHDSPDALLAAYQATSKRIDPALVKLFGKLPRMPYGVRPIPAEQAPDTTTAYYSRPAADGSRPGWYYVNLYRPEVRPIYEIEVLSVHEAVPGHHLQIALAQELGELPNFRRNSSVTAFVEGWGLYAERLGYDMGLYQDPYSRYGQKIYDMWRAVRLVVDTGIHYFGWSRERAIDYFKANAAKTEADIINEIDRYIGWPGQALAYKIGQLKILEIRERAEAALGDRFDIRAFHDHLLGAGAIPLDALEARMAAWIDAQVDVADATAAPPLTTG